MCVCVNLVIQHAKSMRNIVLSIVVCLAPPQSSTLSHKRQDFREKRVDHKTCVLIFSTTFLYSISHSKNNSARYCHKCENIFMRSTRYSCQFLMKLWFSRHFRKESKYQILSKSGQWESSYSMRTEGQT